MRAAGVVADHSADGAAIVRRRVRREYELVGTELLLECVQHDSGLHAGKSLLGVDLDDLVHVLREVENHRHVATLSGQACPCSTSQNRSTVLSADRYCGNHVVSVAWDHQTNGDLTVVRPVGGIHGAAAAVEADFAPHLSFQLSFQLQRLRERIDGLRVRAER